MSLLRDSLSLLLKFFSPRSGEAEVYIKDLAEKDAKLRNMFTLSPVGMAVNDFRTGEFLECNPALLKMTGYTEEEFLRLSYWDITPREYEALEGEQIASLISTGSYGPYLKEYIRKGGQRFPVQLQGTRAKDASGREVIWSVIQDITERVQAEEQSKQQSAFLRTVIDLIPSIVCVKHRDGTFVLANQNLGEVYGATPAEIVGKRDSDFSPSVEQTEGFRKDDLEVISNKQPRFISEERIRRADGQERWLATHKVPLINPDGTCDRLLAVATDITDRKETADKLTKALRKAEEATKAKSDFLAHMSHEIRTPMNGVLGMLSLLRDCELPAQEREYVHDAYIAASSLIGVINDILDFSKIEAGKLSIVPISGSIHALCDTLRSTMGPIAFDKEVAFSISIGENVPDAVETDFARLRQVLVNLIGNAIKFTDAGGRVILLIDSQGRSGIQEELLFSVIDSGMGIAPQQQKEIFEAFVQGNASTTREFGGTGLGLTIASKLVKLMGGNLEVHSTLGSGSVFFFSLRATLIERQAVKGVELQEVATDSLSRSLKVLLVEDNLINQKLACRILEKAGHRVTLASNGEEAVKLSQGVNFDAVLMDIQMPVMDGIGATRRIRESEIGTTKRVPIIALTANAMRGDQERYLAAGMDGYVAKPFDRKQIIEAL